MDYLALFSMPKPVKITGRSSSITNSFVNSIIPVVQPNADEVKQALEILGMNQDNFQCVYCGSFPTEWDHLRPVVEDKKPTGYISEIHNLVPSCGKCNQSKGNKNWRSWMMSLAKLSPKTRGVKDVDERIKKLDAYEKWKPATKIDFEAIVGKDVWEQHWKNCNDIQNLMRNSQELASEINLTVANTYKTTII